MTKKENLFEFYHSWSFRLANAQSKKWPTLPFSFLEITQNISFLTLQFLYVTNIEKNRNSQISNAEKKQGKHKMLLDIYDGEYFCFLANVPLCWFPIDIKIRPALLRNRGKLLQRLIQSNEKCFAFIFQRNV